MKIVAGMGSIDDYVRLVEAGADEVFCGYVPYEWNKKYGSLFPLNRREVLYYNIQINSLEDMKILKRMVEKYKVPVSITFNYLYYLEEQYEEIANIILELIKIGFYDFIIADIALLVYLKEKGIKCSIHLSGECAEINSLSIEFLNKLDISRYIFHRKNSIEDMKSCIKNNKVKGLEYEAFVLNEMCHYSGAFCSSLHCDELAHICKLPYNIVKINEKLNNFPKVDFALKTYYEEENEEEYKENEDEYVIGNTGCGICALRKLKEAGVTHLKVVGRGKYIDDMEKDIKALRKAINIIDTTNNNENIIKKELFKGDCSGKCYY